MDLHECERSGVETCSHLVISKGVKCVREGYYMDVDMNGGGVGTGVRQ